MKEYIKPDVEIISLAANEAVTAVDSATDLSGTLDLSPFPDETP